MIGRKRVGCNRHTAAFLLLVLIASVPTTSLATDESAGTFGASFMRVPVGASAMGAPEIVAGMNPDASMLFSNPADLSGMTLGQVYLSRANWLEDMSLNAASVAVPFRDQKLVWSIGSRLLYSGDLNGFDEAGQIVSSESYYGMAFSTALSRKFEGLGLGLGAGVTYLREKLPLETGDGFAFSLGMTFNRGSHRLAAFAEDLGGKIAFEGRDYPVDSRYVFGYGYSIFKGPGRFDLGLQMTVSRSSFKRLDLGGAFNFQKYFIVRAGLNRMYDAPSQSQMPLSGGLGFRYGSLAVDYAYTSQEYFSNTHTFSVGFGFGGSASTRAAAAQANQPLPVYPPETGSTAAPTPAAGAGDYAVIAGVHSRAASAEAEVRALHLLKVPASVLNDNNRYLVLIGRYDSLERAQDVLAKYEEKGHEFRIYAENH
jgi:hypothetical protein